MSYKLLTTPNGRTFYMAGGMMFSCHGHCPSYDDMNRFEGWKPVDLKEYKTWREMADDIEANGISNPFAPFARDWG